MARVCPLCRFVATNDGGWREHVLQVHDWDPTGEPTHVGDMLVAVGLGFVAFLALMSTALCASGGPRATSCEQFGAWIFAGFVSFVLGILVLAVQPLRRIGQHTWIATRRAGARRAGRRPSPAARAQLRRLDMVTSLVIVAAFGGVFLWQVFSGGFWLIVSVVSFVILAVVAFVRARLRRRRLT